MNSIIFTYAPNLSKKYNQFTVVLQSAQRKGNKWEILERGLIKHTGDIDYLANHAADRFRFKLALDSELEFRHLEARSLVDPNRYDLLRIHPNMLADFIIKSQNQGVLTDNHGNPTKFKVDENVIPKLALENEGFALYIQKHNFYDNDVIVKFLPVTFIFQNNIYQLNKNITYAFLKEIPLDKPIPEQQRESLLMKYINCPDKIRIRTHEKQKTVQNLKDKPILNFDSALRKAQLIFNYDEMAIPDTEPRSVILDPDKNIEVHRNFDRETQYQEVLKKAGFFLRPKDKFNWFLSSRSLSAVYSQLTQNGFALKVNHHPIGHIPEMKWQISSDKDHIFVGGRIFTEDLESDPNELFLAFQHNRGFFKTANGSYGLISDEIKRLLQNLSKNGMPEKDRITFKRSDFSFIDAQFKSDEAVNIDDDYGRLQAFAREFEGIRRYAVPKTLKPVLRDYQVLGYNWLRTLTDLGLNGILSDDMGLGKTLQVLALIKSLKDERILNGPVLLIVPKTLIFNWENEIQKFTPELSCVAFAGSGPETLTGRMEHSDMVITSYHQVRQHIDYFSNRDWSYVILDESQAIKNPAAMITKSVKLIPCEHKLSITGTPVENAALDLWSQFDFLMPGFLRSQKKFKQTYGSGNKRLEDLHTKTKPYILRRLKSQVAKELPQKSEITLFCDFTKDQKQIYEKTLVASRKTIQEKETDKPIDILQLILRLRQIACHPLLAVKQEKKTLTSGKLDTVIQRALEVLSEDIKF